MKKHYLEFLDNVDTGDTDESREWWRQLAETTAAVDKLLSRETNETKET